ncbi:vascular endothelial zinc finger 1-like [Rhincodon typus]|uniref:vascular endothelial zinc finger 1-like n=1 Tax=Rhincodon typus TaxID=259920 RepID=UPI00202E5F45|nr:vascular endothelial zinc finger 1-like [Rhincodon typus]
MEAAWSSFIFPTAAVDQTAGVQADLLPILTATSVSQDSSRAPRASDGPLLPERPKEPQPQAQTEPDKGKARGKGPFVCPLCSKELKNNYNLRRHQRTHSSGGQSQLQAGTNPSPPTMVPIALLSMTMAGVGGGLGSAEAAPQPTGPSPSPTRRVRKEHSCELCGKAFRDIYHLNRHKLSHSDEKPFECPICQQRFKRKDRMCYHVRSHEGGVNKPYLCSHCGKGFSRSDYTPVGSQYLVKNLINSSAVLLAMILRNGMALGNLLDASIMVLVKPVHWLKNSVPFLPDQLRRRMCLVLELGPVTPNLINNLQISRTTGGERGEGGRV